MALVEITIGKDKHQIACSDGDEEKLHNLALRFKDKIETLQQSFPSATEKTLYLMAGLMIIDEIEENPNAKTGSTEDEAGKMLDEITSKVEGLIQKLETSCDVS